MQPPHVFFKASRPLLQFLAVFLFSLCVRGLIHHPVSYLPIQIPLNISF